MVKAILLIAAFVAIASLVAVNINIKGTNNANPQNTSQIAVKTGIKDSNQRFLSIPSLFPEQGWENLTETTDPDVSIVYYSNSKFEEDSAKEVMGSKQIEGKLMRFTHQTNDLSELYDRFAFEKYWSDELIKLGWTFDVEIDNFTFQAPAADGVFGSVAGFLKIADSGQIQLVSYSSVLDAKDFKGEGISLEPVCPCVTTLKLFISDPLLPGEILKN